MSGYLAGLARDVMLMDLDDALLGPPLAEVVDVDVESVRFGLGL